MILAPAVARILSVISLGVVFNGFRMILGWIDRRAGDPIMRERINKGSEKFFVEEEKNWGRSEIDSLLRGDFDNV